MIFHPERINGLQIDVANCALAIAAAFKEKLGRDTFFVFGYRSNDVQLSIWEEGRMKNAAGQWIVIDPKKIVTNAPPGMSPHNFACALDLWVMLPDNSNVDWNHPQAAQILGETARTFKNVLWGGDYTGSFKDIDHIEFRAWPQVKAGTLKIETYSPPVAAK